MEKYELRKGEKYIDEYVDNEGNCVIIFEDESGDVKHGWVVELDDDVARMINVAAAREGIDPELYLERAYTAIIERMIEEDEMRKAIEEISD